MVRRRLGALTPFSRPLLAHLAWSLLVLAAVGAILILELGSDCPPGGPLAFGDCDRVRPLAVAVLALGAALYVTGLSAVLAWTRRLQRRGLADARAARDWYLLAAVVGLPAAPLLAFTIVSALR